MTNSRGGILLQVLVTGVLVALIAAAIMRWSMMNYQLLARGASALQGRRSDESALDSLLGPWNQYGGPCVSSPDYACSGTPQGVCGCTCTPVNPNMPTVTTALVSGSCALTIVSHP